MKLMDYIFIVIILFLCVVFSPICYRPSEESCLKANNEFAVNCTKSWQVAKREKLADGSYEFLLTNIKNSKDRFAVHGQDSKIIEKDIVVLHRRAKKPASDLDGPDYDNPKSPTAYYITLVE